VWSQIGVSTILTLLRTTKPIGCLILKIHSLIGYLLIIPQCIPFCQDYYTVPDIYGSLEWIRRATAIPFLLKAFSDNSLNIKYHIESPGAFWANKKEQMKEQFVEEKKTFKEEYFTKWKQEFFGKIGKVLAGDKNVGKFLHTESVMEVDGINLTETGWKIKIYRPEHKRIH